MSNVYRLPSNNFIQSTSVDSLTSPSHGDGNGTGCGPTMESRIIRLENLVDRIFEKVSDLPTRQEFLNLPTKQDFFNFKVTTVIAIMATTFAAFALVLATVQVVLAVH